MNGAMKLSAPLRATSLWRDALIDPLRRERAVFASLAIYVILWTAYGTVAKSSQSLHPDMTEIVAWSRDLSLGYAKHPPLAAWVVWLWFSIIPVAEWSYYLLAMLMPTIALWIFWRISADYLGTEKRVVGLALLTFVPFFNFHALKFNVNTVLLPLWAATTWFFLVSVRTRRAGWACLAGVAAAGAMLGKYWSIFLLVGLGVAAVIDKRRVEYFCSSAPWITVASGLFLLSPHIVWLIQHDFQPFSYAVIVHGTKSFATVSRSALSYIAGALAYVAVPVIAVLTLARGRKVLADMIWPQDERRRLVATSFYAPLLFPALGAIFIRTEINSLWSMPAFTLLPVVLLSSPLITLPAVGVSRVLLAAATLPLVSLIVSPAIAVMAQLAGPAPALAQTSLLALEVERLWHRSTPQLLRFIGGDADLAYGVATYAVDRPRALTDMPPPPADELRQYGLVWLCYAEDAVCRHDAQRHEGAIGQVVETRIVRNFLRIAGKPQRYTIVIVPPRA